LNCFVRGAVFVRDFCGFKIGRWVHFTYFTLRQLFRNLQTAATGKISQYRFQNFIEEHTTSTMSWNWRSFYFDSMIDWLLSLAKPQEGSEHRVFPDFGAHITYTGMDAWNGVVLKKLTTTDIERLTSFVRSVNEYFDKKKANFDWYFFSDDKDIQ